MKKSTLYQRACFFQEAQLSRRMLCYSDEQMRWNYREKWAKESSPAELYTDHDQLYRSFYQGCKDLMDSIQIQMTTKDACSLLRRTHWYALMSDYSRKSLTFPSDRSPAISSIAQAVRTLSGDAYVAGLWKHGSGICTATMNHITQRLKQFPRLGAGPLVTVPYIPNSH